MKISRLWIVAVMGMGIASGARADNQCPPGMTAAASLFGANCSSNYTCWAPKSAFVDSSAIFGFLDRFGSVQRIHLEYGESAVNPSASGGFPTWYYQCGLNNPDGSKNDSSYIAAHDCPTGTTPYKGANGPCAGQGLGHMCWRPKQNGNMVFQYSSTPGGPAQKALLADGSIFGAPTWYVQCGVVSSSPGNLLPVVANVLAPAVDASSCAAALKAGIVQPQSCLSAPPQPVITLGASSAVAASSIGVSVVNPGSNATDWVGVFPAGVAPVGANMLGWQYLNGGVVAPSAPVTSANLAFPVPAKPGSYVFVLFNTNSYNVILTSSVLNVSAAVVTSTATSTATATITSTATATVTSIGTSTATNGAAKGAL